MFTKTIRPETVNLNEVRNFLDKWSLTASAGGALWVQPRTPVVSAYDFCSMLSRVQRVCAADHFLFVVFHFDGVQILPTSWPIILNAVEVVSSLLDADWWVLRSGGSIVPGNAPREYRTLHAPPHPRDRGPSGLMRLDGTTIVVHPSGGRTQPVN